MIGAVSPRTLFQSAVLPGLHLACNAYDGIGIPDCIRMGKAAAEKLRPQHL